MQQKYQYPYNVVNIDVMRVACYLRVSTEEQKIHGYSIQAQEDALVEYANTHNMKIVKIYRDEGFSGRKPALKRPAMLELLEDAKAGLFDKILFIKLDRWFRNVREYHKIQEILEANHVNWQATMEEYDTSTASGRMNINIRLSVAENEADQGSERVRFVLEAKRRRKELAFGGPKMPFGYTAQKIDGVRRLVKDPETEEMCECFWDHLRKYNSVRLAGMYVNEKYGLTRAYRTWTNMSRKEFYTGTYKGVEGYCPAYVDRDEWEELQQSHVKVKQTQNPNRVYIFAGLLRCPDCGGTLKSNYKIYPQSPDKEYHTYRCNKGQTHIGCNFGASVSELKLEKYLVANIKNEIGDFMLSLEHGAAPKKKKTPAMDVVKLTEQVRRLNKIYMSGNMTDDEYEKETDALNKKIAAARKAEHDERPPDLEVLRRFAAFDFEEIYWTLAPEDKRRLWRSIISEIHVSGPNPKPGGIIFRA